MLQTIKHTLQRFLFTSMEVNIPIYYYKHYSVNIEELQINSLVPI